MPRRALARTSIPEPTSTYDACPRGRPRDRPRCTPRNVGHTVSEEQYNEVNSLASLLLVVAFTKEVDLLMEWSDQQKPDGSSVG